MDPEFIEQKESYTTKAKLPLPNALNPLCTVALALFITAAGVFGAASPAKAEYHFEPGYTQSEREHPQDIVRNTLGALGLGIFGFIGLSQLCKRSPDKF